MKLAIPKRLLVVMLRIIAPVSTLTSAYLYYQYTKGDPTVIGLHRSATFFAVALPKFMHYRAVWHNPLYSPESRSRRKLELDNKYSPILEKYTLKLRGFYLKTAQMLSMRQDILPESYLKWCVKVQNDAPLQLTFQEATQIVEAELQTKLENVFTEFDETPIGCASIGQVYRAKLKSGKVVAVKVQHPSAEWQFRTDLRTLIYFCRLCMPEFLKGLQEIEEQFLTEFDYVQEGKNSELIRKGLDCPEWRSRVLVPRVYQEYTTKNVLTMEYLEDSLKIVDGIKKNVELMLNVDLSDQATIDQLQAAGMKWTLKERLRVKSYNLYSRVITGILNRFLSLWHLILWRPGPFKPVSPPLALDIPRILETMISVHAFQIFQIGAVNGDPHPGNILLLPDGRLGLIDYGQLKQLNPGFRTSLANLLESLSKDDKEQTTKFAEELGNVTQHRDIQISYSRWRFWIGDNRDVDLKTSNIYRILSTWEKQDPLTSVSPEFIVCSRASLFPRSISTNLGFEMDSLAMWLRYSRRYLHSIMATG